MDALGDATFTLGFEGDGPSTGKYTLSVGETLFDDLAEFVNKEWVSEVGHKISDIK